MFTPGKALPELSFTTPDISFWAKRKLIFSKKNNKVIFFHNWFVLVLN